MTSSECCVAILLRDLRALFQLRNHKCHVYLDSEEVSKWTLIFFLYVVLGTNHAI